MKFNQSETIENAAKVLVENFLNSSPAPDIDFASTIEEEVFRNPEFDEWTDADKRELIETAESMYATKTNKNICTLEDFADYINSQEEWPHDSDEIIERNGWEDLNGVNNEFDVCTDGENLLTMSENGKAVVVPYAK